jgi:preprotein translocase subunit SecE
MSEEKKEQSAAPSPEKKRKRGNNRVSRWFREMRSELKKVVWPTPKQIVNNSFVALTVMFFSAIVIWVIDQIGTQIFQAVLLLGRLGN